MKRLAALFSLVVIIAAGLFLFLPHQNQPGGSAGQGGSTQALPTPAAAENHNPRALSAAEQAAFLPLVCGGASGAGGGYAHQCASLPGYPTQDYGGAGLGLGITLKSVVIGHLTSATADEAYVTYAGSFEPHVNNFGGGILFVRAADHWQLKGWYPGGQAAHFVSLVPTGRAKFVCLYSDEAQGEADSRLSLLSLPPPGGEKPAVLAARDLRGTMTPNANCQGLEDGEAVALGIDGLTPAEDGASATLSYVSAKDAKRACAAGQFATAPVSKTTLALRWTGTALKISPNLHLAPAS